MVEVMANLQISEDRLKCLKTIVYYSSDHLLLIYNSTFGIELYTSTGANNYAYAETLIRITDIEDIFIENSELYILTKDKLLYIDLQDLGKLRPDTLWNGTYPTMVTKVVGASEIFIYSEVDQNNLGTAKLLTIRRNASSSSIFSTIECEKGAKQIYVTENQIILVYPTLVTVYRNYNGHPLLETDLPLNSFKKLFFVTDKTSNKTSILKILSENQIIMLEEIDIRNAFLYCNKKPNANITSFEFEIKQELCPCGSQHTLPGLALDCCFVYQTVKVEYNDDLIYRMGIGFLFGLFFGCGVIFLMKMIGIYWVKDHQDSCSFIYSPPIEFDEDLSPLNIESDIKEPQNFDLKSINEQDKDIQSNFEPINIDEILL